MIRQAAGRAALLAAACALVLGVAACSDPEAAKKAEAEAAAKAEKTKAEAKLRRQIDHQVECINALAWKKPALAGAGIGDVAVYDKYFRDGLDKALGMNFFPGEPPRPPLSRPTLDDYLKWSYDRAVKTEFAAGKDYDGDGKVTPKEANNPGLSTVVFCVQEVAEFGVGPLAGPDKVGRLTRMQELRSYLDRRG